MSRLLASGDYLKTSSNILDPNTTAFSCSCWIYPTTISGSTYVFVSQQDGTGIGRSWLAINTTDKLESSLGGTATIGATTLSVNTLYHVGLSVPSGVGSKTIELILNGSSDGSGSVDPESADGDHVFGIHKGLSIQPYIGRIAEGGFWNAQLSSDEWIALGKGASPRLIRPQNLLANWNLFGNNSPDPDYVGGYDLTLSGTS